VPDNRSDKSRRGFRNCWTGGGIVCTRGDPCPKNTCVVEKKKKILAIAKGGNLVKFSLNLGKKRTKNIYKGLGFFAQGLNACLLN
jgi:hypothetical protein